MEIWRIIHRNVQNQKWTPLKNRFYFSKGAATGVLKRNEGLNLENWDDAEKMWVHPSGRLVYRIQSAVVDWKDCETL